MFARANPADMAGAELLKEQQDLLAEPSVKTYWDYSAMSLRKREGLPKPLRTEAVERLAAVEHELLRRHPLQTPGQRLPM